MLKINVSICLGQMSGCALFSKQIAEQAYISSLLSYTILYYKFCFQYTDKCKQKVNWFKKLLYS